MKNQNNQKIKVNSKNLFVDLNLDLKIKKVIKNQKTKSKKGLMTTLDFTGSMSKESFEDVIKELINQQFLEGDMFELGVDVYNFCEGYHRAVGTLFTLLFNKDQLNALSYFLYGEPISASYRLEDSTSFESMDVDLLWETLQQLK